MKPAASLVHAYTHPPRGPPIAPGTAHGFDDLSRLASFLLLNLPLLLPLRLWLLFCTFRHNRDYGLLSHRDLSLLLPPIQPAQISLPTHRNHTREDIPILPRYKSEVEGRHRGPDLPAVLPTHGHGIDHPLFRVCPTATCQQRLHSKEIDVEERCEECLVDDHFDGKAEEVGAVVEVVPKEDEPFVARD